MGIEASKKRTKDFRGWIIDLSNYELSEDGSDHESGRQEADAELRLVAMDEERERRDRRRSELGLSTPIFEEGRL